MKRNDIKYIIIFILLIILIVVTIVFSYYKNKPLNVNRKIEYIFNNLTYDNVLNMSKDVFNNALKLIRNDYEYEKVNNEIVLYKINDYNSYKKILNYSLIKITLKNNMINNFLNNKRIINYKDGYYIESYVNNYNRDYVGSILIINSYGENFVNLKSTNYYCDNGEFIGVLTKEPDCEFTKSETKFTLSLEKNILKVNNIDEIAKILV